MRSTPDDPRLARHAPTPRSALRTPRGRGFRRYEPHDPNRHDAGSAKQARAYALYLTACGSRPAVAAKNAWSRYFGPLRDADAAEWLRLIAVCRAVQSNQGGGALIVSESRRTEGERMGD